jgi:UDP:flavonoid glycosyltransferase YjiC (YdhE family)
MSGASFLFAFRDGGGSVPPQLAVARRLVARGHRVRVLTESPTPAFAERLAATGCVVVPYQPPAEEPVLPPMRGLAFGWSPLILGMDGLAHARHLQTPRWAGYVFEELRRERADVVLALDRQPGILIGAEAAGVPVVSLIDTIYMRPAPGAPPYPSDFLPARGPIGRLRDALFARAVARVFRRDVLPLLNIARRSVGLAPLRDFHEQYDRAARVLVMTSPFFDFPARSLPANVRYVGMPFDDLDPPPTWDGPWPPDDPRPLVVASVSITVQGKDQGKPLQRTLDALGRLPVRGLATLGPHLPPHDLSVPANIVLEAYVPHAAVLPRAAAMVTHAGHSGVMTALAHGVPLVCLPGDPRAPNSMRAKDQLAIATRVVASGAGLRVDPNATSDQIREAVERVLVEGSFRAAARRIGERVVAERGTDRAVAEIEALVPSRASALVGAG